MIIWRRRISTWFHATDIPKSKPSYFNWKPDQAPQKFQLFSSKDCERLDAADAELKNIQTGSEAQTNLPKTLVKEDGLFQVDVKERELRPVYWEGPVYEVRKGTWFFTESSIQPVSEKLAAKLEELYNKLPNDEKESKTTTSSNLERAQSEAAAEKASKGSKREFQLDLEGYDTVQFDKKKTVAYLSKKSDQNFVLQKIYSSHKKIVRGYPKDLAKALELERAKQKEASKPSKPSSTEIKSNNRLESILFPWKDTSTDSKMESQMKQDYSSDESKEEPEGSVGQLGDDRRPIDHLVLCVHGIGQKLTQRVESVNFVHDVNLLRKLFKTIEPNNRVQALPVLWRHDISFGTEQQVSLRDITIDSIHAIRNLAGDVVIDVLLYEDPTYRKEMIKTVTNQLNSLVKEYCTNNPEFAANPKISIVGHSLGSVIMYEVLSQQKKHIDVSDQERQAQEKPTVTNDNSHLQLDFKVDTFFTLGSPLALFLLINNRKVTREELAAKVMYNVFHPSDPIAFRFEPLVHPKAGKLTKPKVVPYTKGGLTTQIQELSEFGQKIFKGASVVWNNVTSLYRSEIIDELLESEKNHEKEEAKKKINAEKTKKSSKEQDEHDQTVAEVREALKQFNPSGSIDYSLQEGVLDISMLAAIASHISYFENADVASFILSQIGHVKVPENGAKDDKGSEANL